MFILDKKPHWEEEELIMVDVDDYDESDDGDDKKPSDEDQ